MSLDELVAKKFIPIPQHIKIDVDGIEHKIIQGAASLLKNKELKSVLVELNTNLKAHVAIIEEMRAQGFLLSSDQVERSLCKEGVFQGVGNHIFYRPPKTEWENLFSYSFGLTFKK